MSLPKHIFMDMHIECNLKCIQCDIWKLTNPHDELMLDERKSVISQIASWDKSIRLVLTGGEQFLRRKYLYELAAECKRNGVYTTISSNGTILKKEDFECLPSSGINCIVFSIDSHLPEIHDKIRGVKGTWERVVESTRKMVRRQKEAGENFSVLVSVILGEHNLSQVNETVLFIEELGVDTILFQPIQPNFAATVKEIWWKEQALFPEQTEAIYEGIDKLIVLKEKGHRLYQKNYQFEDMRSYFLNPSRLHKQQCHSMHENMMIDMQGNVRLCFNMERIGMLPAGNIRNYPLREIWEGSRITAEKMKGCSECCGAMVCHSR